MPTVRDVKIACVRSNAKKIEYSHINTSFTYLNLSYVDIFSVLIICI